MSVSFPYDTSYPGPAFPVFTIAVTGRSPEPVQGVSALVDSGADATLIPLQMLEQIDARRVDVVWAHTVTGQRYQAYLYRVMLTVGEKELYGVEVVANDRTDEVIIGRDVLNQLFVTLDGPGETVQVDD